MMKTFLPVTISLVFSALSFAGSYNQEQIKKNITSEYSSWGISQTRNLKNENPSINLIDALKVFKKSKKAVTIAVVDTGIKFNHEFLKDNIYADLTTKATRSNYGKDFSRAHKNKITNKPKDSHGHGTHVSGIIKSVFPDVRIIPIKYYNAKASGEENLVNSIKALEYAVSLGVDIINYSGGGPEADSFNKAKELRIVKEAKRKGILLVAASGNNGSNIDSTENRYFPASYNLDNILTVASYDQNLKLLASSNYGVSTVHVGAPGYKINSATHKFAGKMSGTSQATAFVSGISALVKSSYPELTYSEIKSIIISAAKTHKNFEGKMLGGQVDAYKSLVMAKQLVEGKKKIALRYKKLKNQRKVARN